VEFPKIVSADDHVVEPPNLWLDRLPKQYLDVGPRVVRERGHVALIDGDFKYTTTDDGDPVDVWVYEDMRVPSTLTGSAAGYKVDDVELRVITFDDMRAGCYDPAARLLDMDIAGVEASLCFPNLFVRFCGQRFTFAKDKELAHLCVQAYNDFMVDEWCGPTNGRLVPLGILPLWDSQLCAQEVRRMAARGMHAICFSEIPPYLGLPSIHTNYWDPLFQACEDTGTVLMMHIGSGSKLPVTSEDAPPAVQTANASVNSAMCMVDWLFSGVLIRFPTIKLGLAECQIGWIPYFLQRCDQVWEHNRGWNEVWGKIPQPPSSYYPKRIYCSFFSDPFGMQHLEEVGADNVVFEMDYPHSDTNWPDTTEVARKETAGLSPEMVEKVVRGNAMKLLGLA
jgi:predicted TIM-barrel fold metal-dependent hydrolase